MTGLPLSAGSPAAAPVCGAIRAAGRLRTAAAAGAILAVAVAACGLRLTGLDAPFESSDQAEMPRAIQYAFGLRAIAVHAYGPMIAALAHLAAATTGLLGWPMTEAACRWPVALVGLLQVPATWALVVRLRRGHAEALAAAAFCAVLPTMVADARCTWAWGYLTLWVFLGTIAIWSTLAWFDGRRPIHLALAGTALAGHLLSNCFSAGVPAALLVAWWRMLHGTDPRDGRRAERSRAAHFAAGFLAPCLLALSFMAVVWIRTGGGPPGRLMLKHRSGTLGFAWDRPAELAAVVTSQVGYLFALLLAGAAIAAVLGISGRRRLSLPAVWALAGFAPLLASDFSRIGYPGAYFIEFLCAAGLAVIAGVFDLRRRWAGRPALRAAVTLLLAAALAHMSIGSIDDNLGRGALRRWTGIACGWAGTDRDTGIKAAGWYVRRHVPPNAVVLCLHTNRGMEAPVAEFYCGRAVLAGRDLPEPLLGDVLAAFAPHSDVVVAEARHQHLVETLADFEPVAVFEHSGRRVRVVFARRGLELEHVSAPTGEINRLYDRQYAPRRVPVPLETFEGCRPLLLHYRDTLKSLKQGFGRPAVPAGTREENHEPSD